MLFRSVPVTVFKDEPLRPRATGSGSGLAMEIDVFGNNIQQMEEAMSLDNTPGPDGVPEMTNLIARIETDGLLLYVSEASYQPVSFQVINSRMLLNPVHSTGGNTAVLLGTCEASRPCGRALYARPV